MTSCVSLPSSAPPSSALPSSRPPFSTRVSRSGSQPTSSESQNISEAVEDDDRLSVGAVALLPTEDDASVRWLSSITGEGVDSPPLVEAGVEGGTWRPDPVAEPLCWLLGVV
jgi:hypothetical protein